VIQYLSRYTQKVRHSESHLWSVNEQNMMFYKSDYCQINEMKTRTLIEVGGVGVVEFVRRYLSLILSKGLWEDGTMVFYLIIVGARNTHAFINKHTVQHLIKRHYS
jgi:hypothetical protein